MIVMKRMKLTERFLGVLLGLCLISPGCSKDEYEHYVFSDTFLGWVDFERGSYWIYRNENSGKTDSASIWQRTFSTSDEEKSNGYYFDCISGKYKSGFLQSFILQSKPEFESAEIETQDTLLPGALRTGAVYNQEYEWNGGTFTEYSPIDTLVLNGKTYLNVRHTRSRLITGPDSLIREYYFARHIGLIRYRQQYRNTDSVWSVLRYNVTQKAVQGATL